MSDHSGTGSHCGVEDVDSLNGGFPFLLHPKNQVNPVTQCLGHVVRFQRLPIDQDEQTRIIPGPGWQGDIVHTLTILPQAKVKP